MILFGLLLLIVAWLFVMLKCDYCVCLFAVGSLLCWRILVVFSIVGAVRFALLAVFV